MSDQIFLLPHPGRERLPREGSNLVGWPSRTTHARKFLRARGEWVLSNGEAGESWLEFWGEYEGPTVCEFLPANAGGPKVVQSIIPNPGSPTLNTDPWVFFPGFIWSICRHTALRTAVQAGDLVLFGSTINGQWLLDTAFVAKERRTGGGPGEFGAPYDRLVLRMLPALFEPFVGQPFNPSTEMFSFVPAARADAGHNPFARVSMNMLFSLLRKNGDGQPPSPANAQALVACTHTGGAQAFWDRLVEKIEDAGLVLGTSIHHPSTTDQLPQDSDLPRPCTPRGPRGEDDKRC
jgi:hypothetical protein